MSIVALLAVSSAMAQSTIGITGVPDTSYTTNSAYNSTRKNYPQITIVKEIKSDSIGENRDLTYCQIEKRQLKLDVFYPNYKAKGKRTAVLIVHGGGWRSGNRSQHYPMAQRLAKLGYVCFTPEYRLSTEALFPAAVHDIKSAIRWVRANAGKYNIDTTRIVVTGFSAGGELAAFMGSTNGYLTEFQGSECSLSNSGLVQGIIDIDGTLSFVHAESGEGDDSKKISAATYWFGYTKKENFALWERASPLTHAGPHSPPTLFINSSVARMHAGRDDYIKILDSWKIYTEVFSFADAPHSFCLFDPWFEPTIQKMDDFLKKIFIKKK